MRILLATDGSETAVAAAEYLAAFPTPPDTHVTVLTVIKDVLLDHEIESLTQEQWDVFEREKKDAHRDVNDVIDTEVARLRDAGFDVSSEIRTGHPAHQIVLAAEAHQVDIIAVGSHGLTGFRRFLLGSVSNQVLQSAKCSVLIVRKPEEECRGGQQEPPAADGHAWRFLIAYDDSEPARKAVDLCASLPLDETTTIELLTVFPMVHMFRQDIRQELNVIWQQKTDAERGALEAASKRLPRRRVVTQILESADVSDAILEEGERFEADVIVLGHKGKGAIETFLMGSVTPRIAHHACRSILAVR